MVERYLKFPALIFYTIVLMLLFYTGYFNRLVKLPDGCDEFGYLNIAKAISQGSLFKDHAERPFDKGLIGYLRQSPYPYESYEFLICPHAYFLNAKKFKITNTYPPGTGILLSPLPFDTRKTAFSAVCALLIVLFLIFAFKARAGKLSFFNINMIAVITFVAFMSNYFPHGFSNYDWVNSYAPTFGMLLAAGYLLDKRPGMSIALLGTSTVFRIANVIILVPFLLIYLGRGFHLGEYFSKETLLRAAKAIVFYFVGGFGLYLLYVWVLLGNPFSPTYSYANSEAAAGFSLLKNIPQNIGYYFGFHDRWLLFHVFIFGCMALMGIFKKMPVKWIIIAMVIALFNCGFYFVHLNKIDYYLYASAMIIAGIFLNYAEEYIRNTVRFRRIINYAGAGIILAAVVFSILRFPRQDLKQQFNDQIKAYNNCFSGYDVVWAELRSGTVEYATGKAAFRFEWGPQNVRKNVLSWLHTHGYRQAIWVSDLNKSFLDTVNVEKELKNIPVDYAVKTCPDFGTIIEVR